MIESLDDTTGTGIKDGKFLIIGIDDGHFGTLEWYAETITDVVFTNFSTGMWKAITFDGNRQTSSNNQIK